MNESDTQTGGQRDTYLDALRAGALLVVVFGHWLATLPVVEDGLMVGADHLLDVWAGAPYLTWVLQVVPLFVFVSAAVSADSVARRSSQGASHARWWAGRALGLARPTVTYLTVLVALVAVAEVTGGRFFEQFDGSLTVHLWFLAMLLTVQALLPVSVAADSRFGLKAVGALIVIAVAADMVRGGVTSPTHLLELGGRVTATSGGVAWVNLLAVWLLPQQLGIAWRRGRLGGMTTGFVLLVLGVVWLTGSVAAGYPVAMVGADLSGASNLLPPTLALIGVMWIQVGAVLMLDRPARRLLSLKPVGRVVTTLGALGMPLYLWHKLAELPAAIIGERLVLPLDAGIPGDLAFWAGRLWWVVLCLLMVAPVLAAVAAFESRRRRSVPPTSSVRATIIGGILLVGGVLIALYFGSRDGAVFALAAVAISSWTLRARKPELEKETSEE